MSSSESSLLMVVGLWVVMAIFCCGGGGRTLDSKPAQTSAPIVVTAPVLVADYEANEVAADQKYKDRTLQVTGVINAIGKDLLSDMYVVLDGGQEFGLWHVQCMFPDSEEQYLAHLQKGQSLTVTGRCEGKLGGVLLRECEIKGVGN